MGRSDINRIVVNVIPQSPSICHWRTFAKRVSSVLLLIGRVITEDDWWLGELLMKCFFLSLVCWVLLRVKMQILFLLLELLLSKSWVNFLLAFNEIILPSLLAVRCDKLILDIRCLSTQESRWSTHTRWRSDCLLAAHHEWSSIGNSQVGHSQRILTEAMNISRGDRGRGGRREGYAVCLTRIRKKLLWVYVSDLLRHHNMFSAASVW